MSTAERVAQVLAFLKPIEIPARAFSQYSPDRIRWIWFDCLHQRGIETRYGRLPILIVGILEREGYDPENKTGLPTEVFLRWRPVSKVPA